MKGASPFGADDFEDVVKVRDFGKLPKSGREVRKDLEGGLEVEKRRRGNNLSGLRRG